LLTALTHSSYASEHGGESNERLEFLGDAVVELAVTECLIRDFTQLDQGTGTSVRKRVVNEPSLAEAARRLDLGAYLRIGGGVRKERGNERDSILADTFEALVAAIYLDGGFELATSFVLGELRDAITQAAAEPNYMDPKSHLAHWAAVQNLDAPRYDVTRDGPSHEPTFVATVIVGAVTKSGSGTSKKSAEAAAAEAALKELGDA
jgi:ribonuclease-3